MKARRMRWVGLTAGILALATGCRHQCFRCDSTAPPAVLRPVPSGSSVYSQPPRSKSELLLPSPTAPLPTSPPSTSGSLSSPIFRETPPPPVAAPPNGNGDPRPNPMGVRLLPPDLATLPGDRPAPIPEGSATPNSPLPVGIPEFADAKSRVASGLKPSLDGLDWLRANGYRAVLHLRTPGESDTADRAQVEKRGLNYLSLEVGPGSLSRDLLDQFNATVEDATRKPLFVYDRNGVLSGAMWYLHFRTAEKLGDEEARRKAAPLGLRPDGDDERRTMWVAIQAFLRDRP